MRVDHLKQLPPDWEVYSSVFNALGDPQRQKILLLFERRERLTIKQIVDVVQGSRTATVHHLRVLEDAGILHRQRIGKEVQLWIDKKHLMRSIRSVTNFIFWRV